MANMRKILFAVLTVLILAACGNRAGGKKVGNHPVPQAEPLPETSAENATEAVSDPEFTFDELWKIFCVFGKNIAPEIIDTQEEKDNKKALIEEMFHSSMYTNMLTVGEYDINGCGTDFTMACYRYPADGHILALLLETTGCDVSSQSVRSYEYDPEQGSAREIPLPIQVNKADFDDYIRHYRLKDAAKFARIRKLDYIRFMPSQRGVDVLFDVEEDYNEDWWMADPRVAYLWNGSDFEIAPQQHHSVLTENRFAGMKIGDPLPGSDFRDPAGVYTLQATSEGTVVRKNGEPVLVIRGQGVIDGFQVLSPEYCDETGLHVGTRFSDSELLSSPDLDFTQVWCYPDGTVTFCLGWQEGILFEVKSEALLSPKVSRSEMGTSGLKIGQKPVFSPDAVITSIYLVGSED